MASSAVEKRTTLHPAEGTRPARQSHYVVWLPAAILFVLMADLVYLYGVNIPFNDDFDIPGHFLFQFVQGHFEWRYLWEQNVDSRLIFPKLIWLAEACTVGWSTKHWMYGGLVLALAEIVLVVAILVRTNTNKPVCWGFSIFAAFVLLHPGNAPGSLLRGSQSVIMFPSLFLLLGCYLYLLDMSLGKNLFIYILLATLSSFSFANGMLLWVLLFPIWPLWNEFHRGEGKHKVTVLVASAFALAFGLLVIMSYFRGYTRATAPSWNGRLMDFLYYFASWLGASLGSRQDVHFSYALGLVLLLIALVVGALILMDMLKARNTKQLPLIWPWLLLIGYVGISGLANTLGRQGMGLGTANHPRYFMTTLLFPLGLAGLLSSYLPVATRSSRTRTIICRTLLFAGLIGGSLFSLATWSSGWQRSYAYWGTLKRRELALTLWRDAPDIYPLPVTLAKVPARFRTHYFALVEAGILPNPGASEWLLPALTDALQRRPVGEFSIASKSGVLVASGWALHPDTRLPFFAGLAAIQRPDGSLRPINVALMTEPGPMFIDRSDAHDQSHFLIGFRLSPLWSNNPTLADTERIRMFAINPNSREAFPLLLKPQGN